MNIISMIMAMFSLFGAFDLLIGNRLGAGKEFERGIRLLGTMALSMIGMIVIAPLIAHLLQPLLSGIPDEFPFDPSSIAGILLANDMGGAPLAMELAKTEAAGYFNGLVVSSMMGATISFSLPFAFNEVGKEQHDDLLLGLMCGIIVIPLGCFVSGLMIGMQITELLVDLTPLLVFCILLAVGLLKFPKISIRIFNVIAVVIRCVILLGLAVGIFKYLTGIQLIPHTASIEEGVSVVFNASAVMSGAFPLMWLVSKLLSRPLKALGRKIGINETSALGFVSTLATNVTTFSLMKHMDSKGTVLNAAFAVSAAFTFAGHLAFTLSVNADYVPCVIVGKLISGAAALFVAQFMYRRMEKRKSEV